MADFPTDPFPSRISLMVGSSAFMFLLMALADLPEEEEEEEDMECDVFNGGGVDLKLKNNTVNYNF